MVPADEHPFAPSLPDRILYARPDAVPCTHPECRMPVLWCLNKNGNNEPLDATAKPKDGKLISHFAICKHAKKFRRKRG
jgi:hypothetical protein